MKKIKIILLLVVFAPFVQFQQPVLAQVILSKSVFGNGGAMLSDSSHHIVGTLGQTGIGVTGNSSNIHEAGFWYQAVDFITSIEQISEIVPEEYRLEQNHPNPFNPITTIEFALPHRSAVTLKLYDLLGRDVVTLVDTELEPGVHKVVFDAKDLPSGIYFYQIRAEDFVQAKKLTLLK